jgi:hypothetical protein
VNEELTTGGQIEVPLKLWKLGSAKISLIGRENHFQHVSIGRRESQNMNYSCRVNL